MGPVEARTKPLMILRKGFGGEFELIFIDKEECTRNKQALNSSVHSYI